MSLVNMVIGQSKQPEPEVGMGATVLMYSDRHAATIVEVLYTKAGKLKGVVIQGDKATRVDNNGMSEGQSYEFEPQPDAPKVTYTYRSNGRLIKAGEPSKYGTPLSIGHRSEYYDYSF